MICPDCGEDGVGKIPVQMVVNDEYGCYLCGWTGGKSELPEGGEDDGP